MSRPNSFLGSRSGVSGYTESRVADSNFFLHENSEDLKKKVNE